MDQINALIAEFREKKLWPIALALLAALIAVPVLLSKSSSTQAAPAPAATPSAPTAAGAPISVTTTKSQAPQLGRRRDPFIQQPLPVAAGASTAASTSSTNGSSSGSSPSSSGASTSGSASTSGVTSSGVTSSGVTSSGVTSSGGVSSSSSASGSTVSEQTSPSGSETTSPSGVPHVFWYRYSTTLEFGPATGKLRTIHSTPRFTPLPSAKKPLLLFLGVKSDGRTAVFLVSSAASVTGEGKCTPSRSKCEFLALPKGRQELVLAQNANGSVSEYDLSVRSIGLVRTTLPQGKKPAAEKVSKQGSQIVTHARRQLRALRTLRYSPRTGLISPSTNLFQDPPQTNLFFAHLGRVAVSTAPGVLLHPFHEG